MRNQFIGLLLITILFHNSCDNTCPENELIGTVKLKSNFEIENIYSSIDQLKFKSSENEVIYLHKIITITDSFDLSCVHKTCSGSSSGPTCLNILIERAEFQFSNDSIDLRIIEFYRNGQLIPKDEIIDTNFVETITVTLKNWKHPELFTSASLITNNRGKTFENISDSLQIINTEYCSEMILDESIIKDVYKAVDSLFYSKETGVVSFKLNEKLYLLN